MAFSAPAVPVFFVQHDVAVLTVGVLSVLEGGLTVSYGDAVVHVGPGGFFGEEGLGTEDSFEQSVVSEARAKVKRQLTGSRQASNLGGGRGSTSPRPIIDFATV